MIIKILENFVKTSHQSYKWSCQSWISDFIEGSTATTYVNIDSTRENVQVHKFELLVTILQEQIIRLQRYWLRWDQRPYFFS